MLEKREDEHLRMKLRESFFMYRLNDSLMWLFNVATGVQYDLNEPSYFVLSLLDGKSTVTEIRQLYVSKYSNLGANEKVLLEDFNNLVQRLINEDVVICLKSKQKNV
jgi:Coenzyme PQQ synthesis protein D (PqqD)